MSTEHRIERLRTALAEKQVDVFLATNTADIRWLTGFSRVFDEEQAHLAIVCAGAAGAAANDTATGAAGGGGTSSTGKAQDAAVRTNTPGGLFLHTDTRYSGAMRERNADGLWELFDERVGHSAYAAETLKRYFLPQMQSAAWQGSRAGVLHIGIEASLPLNAWRALREALDGQFEGSGIGYELVELEGLTVGLRARKDSEEVQALRAAQAVTDAGFTHMLSYLKPGISEREAAVELEFFMRRAGADGLAFPSILASGPHAAIPHHIPGDRVFQEGDFVLMDFGAKVDDYRSDMTRTVVLGQASERQREIYNTVLRAQTEAIALLRAGIPGTEPQALVDAIFEECGFGKLSHGLGHGVGIDIHEQPVISGKSKDILVAGDVVTVEPGIYLEGFGGVRIEDFGLITEEGFNNFTASPHELFEL